MFPLSGISLDYYDDPAAFPEATELLKTASVTSTQLRDLPDHLFAMVVRDGSQQMRKFACCDAANTAVSIGAFLTNVDKMPEKVASQVSRNLVEACSWYDLVPPAPLLKVALALPSLGTAMTLAGAALTVPGAVKETSRLMRQNKDLGGAIATSGMRALS